MRIFVLLLLVALTGCSNAPLANTLDAISPGRVRPERNLRQDRGPTPPNIPSTETEIPVPPRPNIRSDNDPISPVPPKGRSDETTFPPLPPTPTERD